MSKSHSLASYLYVTSETRNDQVLMDLMKEQIDPCSPVRLFHGSHWWLAIAIQYAAWWEFFLTFHMKG